MHVVVTLHAASSQCHGACSPGIRRVSRVSIFSSKLCDLSLSLVAPTRKDDALIRVEIFFDKRDGEMTGQMLCTECKCAIQP